MDGSVSQEGHYYSTRPRRRMTELRLVYSSVVVENMRARLSLVTCWFCDLAALLTASLA